MKFLKLLITTLIVAALIGLFYGILVSDLIAAVMCVVVGAGLIAGAFYVVYMFVDVLIDDYEWRRKNKEWSDTWSVIEAAMKEKVEKE